MGAAFTIPAAAAQIFQISFTCRNANNSHNGHALTFVLGDSGVLLWDNTASQTVWSK
jgi:hypothetical protein